MHSTPKNRIKPTTDTLPVEIADLRNKVAALPPECRAEIEKSVERVVEFTQRRRRILNLVQEALGQLRLDMKYLMFDLDATRRERDLYKKTLEGDS